jgi:DNA-binding XRE family transcriptional regulator
MTRLRDLRDRAGLSQAELAEQAEVSRATVGAVEQGRHVPAADAAVRIARVLGTTVEALFAPPAPATLPAAAVLGGALPDGAPVRAGSVGGRVVADPLGPDEWAAPDAIAERGGRLRLAARAVPAGLVVTGCDPALGIAAGLLGPERLVAIPATSGQARAALDAGRCHGALVHGPRLSPPAGVVRLRFARWRAGVAYDRSLGAPSLEALIADVPLVGRPRTAASQQAVDRAARRLGVPRPSGEVAETHVDAARRAHWQHCAAVTIEPVAARFGLGFTDLEEHTVELWVAEHWAAHPGLAALADLLRSSAFRDRLAPMPGYDVSQSGETA